MKAYVLRCDQKIEPLGECPRDCLIANKPLKQLQNEVLGALGFQVEFIADVSQISEKDEYIVLDENLYFTVELLGEFIAKARKLESITVCALKSGVTTLRTAVSVQNVKIHQDRVEYNLRYFPKMEKRGDVRTVLIDPDELSASIAMPRHMCGSDKYSIPITDKFVIQIDHWVNLWIANIITALGLGVKLQKKSKMKLLLLALKARSFNKWNVFRQTNKIGRNCDIHPTAYIEGSIIGDGVTVAAGAIVRSSIIGNGTLLGNGVVVEESVIGQNCSILNGHILYSVFYPRSFSVAEMIPASFLGRDTFVGLNSTLTDFRLDGINVTVLKNGAPIDSGNRFLGSCLGHGVYLGSGCIVAPGRSIPGGLRIALDKDKIVNGCLDGQEKIEGYQVIKNKSPFQM